MNDDREFPPLDAEQARSLLVVAYQSIRAAIDRSGELLGTIAHLEIDDDARTVTAYVLSSSFRDRVMRHDAETIKADEVVRLGEGGVMVVADAVGARLQAERGE